MSELTIFELKDCPYCVQEREIITELLQEHPEYERIEIKRIDESVYPDLADQYDYYYVPSFYLGKKKLYEASRSYSREEAKRRMNDVLCAVLNGTV